MKYWELATDSLRSFIQQLSTDERALFDQSIKVCDAFGKTCHLHEELRILNEIMNQ